MITARNDVLTGGKDEPRWLPRGRRFVRWVDKTGRRISIRSRILSLPDPIIFAHAVSWRVSERSSVVSEVSSTTGEDGGACATRPGEIDDPSFFSRGHIRESAKGSTNHNSVLPSKLGKFYRLRDDSVASCDITGDEDYNRKQPVRFTPTLSG